MLRIYGPKRDEMTGDWSKLHNEDLHNLYPLPSIIKMIKPQAKGNEMGRACRLHGREKNIYRFLAAKP
jgi:hypothetical protein